MEMNILNRPVFRRLLFALVAILTVAQANAENRLYIDNFTINGPEPRTVAVMLDNSDEVAGLQFNIVMPEGIKMVGEPRRNQERFAPGQNMSYSASRGLFMVTSGSGKSFVGNSGVICWIDVQASNEALAAGGDLKVKLDKIVMSSATGQRVPSDKSVETSVTVQDGVGILSATPEFVINPSDRKLVEIALDNNFDVMGLQFVISLPEGFTIVNDEIRVTGRISSGASVSLKPRGENKFGCVVVDYNGNPVVAQGNGNILSFDVVAPADFSAEKAQIVFSGVEMSNRRNATIYGDGCSVNIVNGKTAYDSALARVAELQTKLNAALETIRTECPLVSESFPGTELLERINALDADIDAAYADYTLGANYEQFMGVADAIANDIDAYIESARKAQADEVNRLASNKKAYEADLAAIAGLQEAFDAAKAEIAEKFADFADADAEAAVQSSINELKSAVEAAYSAVAEEGFYNYKLDAAAVEAQIAALVTDAAARYDANRQTLNKAAYDADLAKIAALQAALDAAKAEIAEKYAGFADADAEAAAQASVNALKSAVDAAFAAVTKEGFYDYKLDTTAAKAEIDALVPAAAARYDANRKEVNKAAYDADLAKIAGLQTALNAAKALIAEKYAGFADAAAEAAVQTSINELKSAVDAAYAAVADEGLYDYKLDATAVVAEIAALVTDAAARYEANRQTVNKEACDADLAKIAELQAAFEAAKAEIVEKYAGFANDFEEAATQSSINALKNAVDAAYAAVAKEGFYNYKLDTTAVEAQIAALVSNAAARYEANRLSVNKSAYDADLAKVAELQTALKAAKAEIAEKYAGYGDAVAETEAQAAIDAVKAEVEKAYADVAKEGFYSYKLETTAIEAQIAALVADAKSRWAEANREAANKQAYDADLAKIAALQNSLDAAKAEVAEKYADFADADAEVAAQNAVNELKLAVEAAYAAVAEEGLYDYKLDTTAVEAQIAALVTDAAARYEANRQAVNKAAYDADLAKVAEVQAALDAAKAEIAEKYADFADADAETAAQNTINELKSAVEAAYAAVAKEGVYEYKLDTAAAEAQIAALVTDAAARYEANRQAVNKDAYDADLAKVAELQAALDAAKAEIAEKYADYADTEAEAAVQAAIDAVKAAVEKAYTDVAEEGFYSYELDAKAIESQISALVDDAKARWAEANREAVNKAAYDADLAKVADLQAALDAAKAEIAETYAGFGNETEIESIQSKINSMKAAVEAAYEAVATEGNYNCTLDVENVETRIAALVPEAAEAYRVDFNVKAYNADLDAIAAVKVKYEEALEEVRTKYPGQINNPIIADVLNQITAAQTACMLEFENVRYEGFYKSQVNVQALEQSIIDMLSQIRGAGVDGIYMDEDLEGVEIYTLDGIRRNILVRGQVNVLKYKDGTIKKLSVK